jgi:hypothetical protein
MTPYIVLCVLLWLLLIFAFAQVIANVAKDYPEVYKK